MKKIFFFFIFLIALMPSALNTAAANPLLVLEDETVEFTSEGYTPVAKCADDEILPFVSYFAIDTATSSPVSLPLKNPGTYQVFAKFDGNEKYDAAEVSSLVTIKPIKAKILVNYDRVAYSRMENPVDYTIEPSWAEEYLNITVDYYPIEAIDSYPEEKIPVPVKIGLYYTVFNASSNTSGVECENKYMVYEIAAYRGKKLSETDRALSVPASFSCTFQKLNTVYKENTPVTCQYTLSPAAISGEIFYRKIHTDGSLSPYTKDAPIEPGEYECAYFLGSTVIGKGKIFVDKKEVSISVDSKTLEYVYGGITPTANCESENVEIAFSAFVIDENGNVTLEEVPVPINKCGKYSIIAYPKDAEHFKRTYSYGLLEITPADPEITVTETTFVYDGTEKNIGFETTPKDISCSVEYYEWDDESNSLPLGAPPSRIGKYKAVIKVFDENGNYKEAEKTTLMYIDEPSANSSEESSSGSSNDRSSNEMSRLEITLISILCGVFVIISALLIITFIKKRRSQNS